MVNKIKKRNKDEEIKEDVKKLVKARLQLIPADKRISIGGKKGLSKKEILKRVEKEDEVGKKVSQIQMDYLKSLKKGIFYEQATFDNKTKI